MVEVNSKAAEDAAFAAGETIVIRTDLLNKTPNLLFNMDGINGSTDIYSQDAKGNQVTVIGSAQLSSSFKKFGRSSMLTAVGGYLKCTKNTDMSFSGDFTIEGYVKLNYSNDGKWTFLVSFGQAGILNTAWYVAIMNTTIIFSALNNTVAINATYPPNSDLTNFHHVSLNRVGTTTALYVDGVQLGVTEVTPYNGVGDLYIGGWNYTTANTQGAYLDDWVYTSGYALRTEDFSTSLPYLPHRL